MVDFGVKDGKFITLKEIRHHDVTVKEGYTFDGVTVKVPFRFIFSNRDLLNAVLRENKKYTKIEIDEIIKNYMKGKVN